MNEINNRTTLSVGMLHMHFAQVSKLKSAREYLSNNDYSPALPIMDEVS